MRGRAVRTTVNCENVPWRRRSARGSCLHRKRCALKCTRVMKLIHAGRTVGQRLVEGGEWVGGSCSRSTAATTRVRSRHPLARRCLGALMRCGPHWHHCCCWAAAGLLLVLVLVLALLLVPVLVPRHQRAASGRHFLTRHDHTCCKFCHDTYAGEQHLRRSNPPRGLDKA